MQHWVNGRRLDSHICSALNFLCILHAPTPRLMDTDVIYGIIYIGVTLHCFYLYTVSSLHNHCQAHQIKPPT